MLNETFASRDAVKVVIIINSNWIELRLLPAIKKKQQNPVCETPFRINFSNETKNSPELRQFINFWLLRKSSADMINTLVVFSLVAAGNCSILAKHLIFMIPWDLAKRVLSIRNRISTLLLRNIKPSVFDVVSCGGCR